MLKIRNYLKNKIIQATLSASLVLNLILWALLAYNLKPQAEPLLLHYNIYFGIDLIGPWYQVFYVSGSGLVILLINSLLSFIIYDKDKILSYFSLLACLASQIILLVAGILIILLNQY